MGRLLGAEKFFFLIRDIDDAATAGASVESCRFAARRAPWGRLGSVLDVGNRLRRVRERFQRQIHLPRSFALDDSLGPRPAFAPRTGQFVVP